MTVRYSVAMIDSPAAEAMTDEDVVKRVLGGDTPLFEILMRRYNQRLYRVARAILGNDAEAEDVMQEAHVRAYAHLDQFAGRAKFSTWLTKIAVHEALARVRRANRWEPLDSLPPDRNLMDALRTDMPDPERQTLDRELSFVLETAVEALPEIYRSVFMLREIEEMSVAETGECLGITEENVKARLHRARAMLRKKLYSRFGTATASAFHFHLRRCDRVVHAVFERILAQSNSTT